MHQQKKQIFERACSPLAAAAAGAAICLGGGDAQAVSGNVIASNGGTVFNAPVAVTFFGSQAGFFLFNGSFSSVAGGLRAHVVGSTIYHAPAGVQVSALNNFVAAGEMRPNQSDNYIPLRFSSGGVRYGWVHCVSTNGTASQLRVDTWSYNASGGGIKTLDESVTPKKLTLSDGRLKLNWSNANEDGVARYEIQAKGADGAWAAVDSDTPGAGTYAATVSKGDYRLLVENTDGATRTLAF